MPEKLMRKIENDDFESGLRTEYCLVCPTNQGPFPCRSGLGCPLVVFGRDCQNEPLDNDATKKEVER